MNPYLKINLIGFLTWCGCIIAYYVIRCYQNKKRKDDED